MIGGSLCTGSGGLDLGLERALGIEWAWHCEPDPACQRLLEHHWPGVPNLGDLFAVDWTAVEPVEILAAGFPCPDYSLAGKRTGIEGEHGQVWFGVAAAVRALRPAYLVLENVPGIRTAAGVRVDAGESALGVVLADLAALGYRWAYDCMRAADLGAPHGRDRWFCVAALGGRGERVPRSLAPRPEVDVAGAAADAEGDGGAVVAEGDGGEPAVVGAEPRAGGGDRAGDPAAGVRLVGRGAGTEPRRGAAADAAGERRGARTGLRAAEGAEGDARLGRGRPDDDRREAAADSGSERREGDEHGLRGTEGRVGPGGRGGDSAPDADGGGREELGEHEPGGIEGARGRVADGRGEVRGLAHPETAADAGRERREPGSGRRATRGADARAGSPERDGDGHARPAELGQAEEGRTAADADDGAGDGERARSEPREGGPASPDADRVGRGEGRTGSEVRLGEPDADERDPGGRGEAAPDSAGGGRGRRTDGEGSGGARMEAPVGSEGGEAAGDGGDPGDRGSDGISWGVYEPAIRRWELVLGRSAPRPTDDRGRLDPNFVEWMLGYPDGWFNLPDLRRTQKLRALGNSVQVQCAEVVGYWLAALVESGLLLDLPEAA